MDACSTPVLRLGPTVEEEAFDELREQMALCHFKWDAQVGDVSCLAPFPLLIGSATWRELSAMAEKLCAETMSVEEELLDRPELHLLLGVPRTLRALLAQGKPATPAAVRIMRFDFHWTTEGWRVSEVNSDVPGGYTEATSFTQQMADSIPGTQPTGNPTRRFVDALSQRIGENETIALMNAPGHMEDHQVVAYLAARLRDRGHTAHVIAPTQLRWRDGRAALETAWFSGPAAAVVRFYQAEWLAKMRQARGSWSPLFVGGCTPVANPGIAVLSESKRLPIVWDRLRTPVPTWRRLLPETRELAAAPWMSDDEWLIKSAYCNTGDTVSIRSAMPTSAWWRRVLNAKLAPTDWIAQRRFVGAPLVHQGEQLVVNIGVYTIDGQAAGAYGRIATGQIVDGSARDVAVLIADEE